MLAAGMQINQVTEKLQEHFEEYVDYKAVYDHIRKRGFRVKRVKYTGLKEKPPECDTCPECTAFIMVDGMNDIRCCLRHHQLVAQNVVTSPMWCGRR